MSATIDETDAESYVGQAMRGRLDDLGDLLKLADCEDTEQAVAEIDAVPERLAELGLDPEAFDRDNAEIELCEYPLCVEATTTFEIVLGTGGPDDRLLIECETVENRMRDARDHADYEIRRILYRYSWSGSAERVLNGEDYDVAERFARHVVAELVE